MEAHQAPPSLGFSRQEHWTGLPFPSPMHESEKWKWSCTVVSDSSRRHGLQPTRLLHPWDFPGKSTGVGCHCLTNQLFAWGWREGGGPSLQYFTSSWDISTPTLADLKPPNWGHFVRSCELVQAGSSRALQLLKLTLWMTSTTGP